MGQKRWLDPPLVLAGAVLLACEVSGADLEVAGQVGLLAPSSAERGLSRLGVIVGATALVPTTESLAVGLKIEHGLLDWQAAGAPGLARDGFLFPDENGRMTTTTVLAVGRWYPGRGGRFEPYLQLGLGYGGFQQIPRHPDCSATSGFSAQIAAGLDYLVGRAVRIGFAASAHPFAWSQGCNDIGYDGRPPDPPLPGLALSSQFVFTTLWSSR